MNWKKAFWAVTIIAILVIGILINEQIKSALNQVNSSMKNSAAIIDIQILIKCINNPKLSKDSVLKILDKGIKKRNTNSSDTIVSNNIVLIYNDNKLVKVIGKQYEDIFVINDTIH